MPGNWVRLETFVQAPAWRGGWYEPARLADAPAPAVRVDATFGGEINLAGYTLGEPVGMGRPEGRTTNSEAPVRSTGFSPLRLLLPEGRSTNVERGQVVPLTLHWSAASPPAHDYIVFVHVVGEDGTSLPQDDSMPAWYGQLPTSAWRPGEVVADTRAVRVPADAAAGRYELRAGLYLWETMARLPAADAAGAPLGDYVVLGSLEVVE